MSQAPKLRPAKDREQREKVLNETISRIENADHAQKNRIRALRRIKPKLSKGIDYLLIIAGVGVALSLLLAVYIVATVPRGTMPSPLDQQRKK
mmetsp:Transcript_2438/g.3753  ORF Transcript_2438/g.3753 Transcript_2438/m.3753 type:complete len:93 (-) Transcript_2438:48-326(-)